MNAERLEIARRLVACPKWVWLPGMVALHMDGKYETARIRVDVIDEWCALRHGERWNLRNMLPDLDDELTRLGVLAVVRRAWGDETACVRWVCRDPFPPMWVWEAGEGMSRCTGFENESALGAMLAALEAEPLAREHEVGEVFRDMLDELRDVQSLLAEERATSNALRDRLSAANAVRDALLVEVERLRPLASAEMQRRAIAKMMNGGEA